MQKLGTFASRPYAVPTHSVRVPARLSSIPYGPHFASRSIRRSSSVHDVDERAFRFLCDVIRFVRTVGPEQSIRRLVDQLVASAGSIAANRQEARGASSRREFIRFNEIALRSANETVLWLRAFADARIGDRDVGVALLEEARQLASIIGAIVVRTKANDPRESSI